MSDVTSEEREELKKLLEELNEKSSDMKKLDTTIACQQAQFLIMLQEWKLLVRITLYNFRINYYKLNFYRLFAAFFYENQAHPTPS